MEYLSEDVMSIENSEDLLEVSFNAGPSNSVANSSMMDMAKNQSRNKNMFKRPATGLNSMGGKRDRLKGWR